MPENQISFTSGLWYGTKSGNDSQGLIIEEATGKSIAVAYDVRDTRVLAAAPAMLTALENACNLILLALGNGAWGEESSDDCDSYDEAKSVLSQVNAAIAKAVQS